MADNQTGPEEWTNRPRHLDFGRVIGGTVGRNVLNAFANFLVLIGMVQLKTVGES